MNKEIENYLRGIMYRLFHLNNPNDIYDTINYPDKSPVDSNAIDWEKQKRVFHSLQWVIDHTDFDFKSIQNVRYTNDEILFFLKKEYEWYKVFFQKHGKL